MKKILYLFVAVMITACSEKEKGVDSKIYTEKQVSDFIRTNPQWTKNVKTEAEITEKFKHRLINLSNEPNFLTDLPFQLNSVSDSIVNTLPVKVAVFQLFKDPSRPKESLLNNLELEIRAIMSEDQTNTLKVGQKYLINGHVYKQGKRGDVKFFHGKEEPIYTLGKYTFWNMTVKPLK